MSLPLEILEMIFKYSDFITQLRLTECNKDFHYILKIKDIPKGISWKLTDSILQQEKYKNLKILDASHNEGITNKGIKHMNLHTLDAFRNENITDQGIKHMNLHTLYAAYNKKITDQGIKHMKLHILDASNNKKITK